jgi:hypothetical protein
MTMLQMENKGQYREFIGNLIKEGEKLDNFQSDLVNFIYETDYVKGNGKILVVPEGLTIRLYFKEYVENLLIGEISLLDMNITGYYMEKKFRDRYRHNLINRLSEFESSKINLEDRIKSWRSSKKSKEKYSLELEQTELAIQHMKDYIEFFLHREEMIVDVVWDIHEAINNGTDLFPFFKVTRLYEHLTLGE